MVYVISTVHCKYAYDFIKLHILLGCLGFPIFLEDPVITLRNAAKVGPEW